MSTLKVGLILVFLASSSFAELRAVEESELDDVSGQGGIYLSGDITINENGGPLQNAYFGNCADSSKKCGARIAYQTRENGGWFVMDDIRGRFSFQGLTLRVRHINSGFGGDGAKFDKDVLEIGLPDKVRFDDVRYTYATSSTARPTDPGFQQTNIYSVHMQGDVTMEGNLLVFPTGNP
ncbi:hypothetical protein AAIA72_14015 [Hahella sp. SMD15-11]|uniref:Uncharacterized protein n=1 Tax=Thermohahella caldifontis TaxID=3142973 RepID=A0AB39UUE5_9GAMM